MITTVRVQEKGQVTIPRTIRKKLNIKKGDLVTFVTTPNGVVIKTLDLAADDLFESLREMLKKRDIRLEDLLQRSQKMSSEKLIKEFSLTVDERNLLFQALQLKAQAAVEAIRSSAESADQTDLTEEDIEAEIQAARDESHHADRS